MLHHASRSSSTVFVCNSALAFALSPRESGFIRLVLPSLSGLYDWCSVVH
jgi:hypothetical protein